MVFHRRQVAPPTWWKNTWSRNPDYAFALTSIMPAFGRDPNRFVVTGRPPAGSILGSSVGIATPGSNDVKIVFQDLKRNVLAPAWAPNGERIIFCVACSTRFSTASTAFPKSEDRSEGGAQIAVINPDGTGFRN